MQTNYIVGIAIHGRMSYATFYQVRITKYFCLFRENVSIKGQ